MIIIHSSQVNFVGHSSGFPGSGEVCWQLWWFQTWSNWIKGWLLKRQNHVVSLKTTVCIMYVKKQMKWWLHANLWQESRSHHKSFFRFTCFPAKETNYRHVQLTIGCSSLLWFKSKNQIHPTSKERTLSKVNSHKLKTDFALLSFTRHWFPNSVHLLFLSLIF